MVFILLVPSRWDPLGRLCPSSEGHWSSPRGHFSLTFCFRVSMTTLWSCLLRVMAAQLLRAPGY